VDEPGSMENGFVELSLFDNIANIFGAGIEIKYGILRQGIMGVFSHHAYPVKARKGKIVCNTYNWCAGPFDTQQQAEREAQRRNGFEELTNLTRDRIA
jgi:hypothetical protein